MKQTRVVDEEGEMVVGVPGRLERLDAQAAGLERALDDLEPVALDELVVAGDVVRVRVRRQQVGDLQPLALDGLVQRLERAPLSMKTAVPPGSSARR